MKIALLTSLTPTAENVRGASALPYHMMIERKENIDIDIYTFNYNDISESKIAEVEKTLGVRIHILSQPKWLFYVLKYNLLIIRLLLAMPIYYYLKIPKDVFMSIDKANYDGIWIYGQELSRVAKQFKKYKRVHVLPDCESLFFYRMLKQRFVIHSIHLFWREAIMYRKYIRLEKAYDNSDNIQYMLVGKEDLKTLMNNNTKIRASFFYHPHYELYSKKSICLKKEKLSIVIAGQYNIYMKQASDELVSQLLKHKELSSYYTITFLGRGWEEHVKHLALSGFITNEVVFAKDYIEEVSKHDIQITPISIGTGTKGKVLDALSSGLLVLGTPYAMENIFVDNGKSCLEYAKAEDVIEILKDIPLKRELYEQIAKAGRENVLSHHSRRQAATLLFNKFK